MSGYVIEVRGIPAPQGSKRHIGNGRMIEMSKAVGPWREAVRAETMKAVSLPLDGGVRVRLRFYFRRPNAHYRTKRGERLLKLDAPPFPAARPDVDKLARAVLDGLTEGGAWGDDGQVVLLVASKRYCAQYEVPRCEIEIEELESGT